MSSIRKATETIESYGKMVRYFTVPYTRRTAYTTYRVQAVMGHCRDIGFGKTYEDAKKDAAEKVLDKFRNARISVANKTKNHLIKNVKLQKQIQALELCKRKLAMRIIDLIWNKINHGSKIGKIEAHNLYREAEEVLVKIGFTLKMQEREVGDGRLVVLTIKFKEFPSRTIVEVGKDEVEIRMKALANILFMERWRLFVQIGKQMEDSRKARAARFTSKSENMRARTNSQRRYRD